jgi:hypothetical protein
MADWAKRKVYLATPEFSVSRGRFCAVCRDPGAPMPPDLEKISHKAAALTFAREQGIAKLGPPKPYKVHDSDGRAKAFQLTYHPWSRGGFGVVAVVTGNLLIIEGPPESNGWRPGWGYFCDWEQEPIEGEPGLFRLIPPPELVRGAPSDG